MKAYKKAFLGSMVLAGGFMLAMGSFNSIVINHSSFMRDDYGIRFAKSLDEMNGEVIKGRVTASIPKFTEVTKKAPKKVFKASYLKSVKREVVKQERSVERPSSIKGSYNDLSLTGGIVNKNKVKDNLEYYGSISAVSNGVIEGLKVGFPDGREYEINTVGRIQDNFFKYYDTETGAEQTGLIYGVKENESAGVAVLLVQLPSDSNLAGARLEFKTEAAANVQKPQPTQSIAKVEKVVEENYGNDKDYDNENAYAELIKEDTKVEKNSERAQTDYSNDEQAHDLERKEAFNEAVDNLSLIHI